MWKDVPHTTTIMGERVFWYDDDEPEDEYMGLSYFDITGRGEGC